MLQGGCTVYRMLTTALHRLTIFLIPLACSAVQVQVISEAAHNVPGGDLNFLVAPEPTDPDKYMYDMKLQNGNTMELFEMGTIEVPRTIKPQKNVIVLPRTAPPG
jgi:hypothetical protein